MLKVAFTIALGIAIYKLLSQVSKAIITAFGMMTLIKNKGDWKFYEN